MQVSIEKAQELSRQLKIPYLECSAKGDYQTQNMFARIQTNSSFIRSENQRRSSFPRARSHRAKIPAFRAPLRLQGREEEEQEEVLRPLSPHTSH